MSSTDINKTAENLIQILESKKEPSLTKEESSVMALFLKSTGDLSQNNSNKLMFALGRIENLPKSPSFIKKIAEKIFPPSRDPTYPLSPDIVTRAMIHCATSLNPNEYEQVPLKEDKSDSLSDVDAESVTSELTDGSDYAEDGFTTTDSGLSPKKREDDE